MCSGLYEHRPGLGCDDAVADVEPLQAGDEITAAEHLRTRRGALERVTKPLSKNQRILCNAEVSNQRVALGFVAEVTASDDEQITPSAASQPINLILSAGLLEQAVANDVVVSIATVEGVVAVASDEDVVVNCSLELVAAWGAVVGGASH